ncbi:hypothetical protein AB0N06_34970 [Streptomyces sp. NPDC051020]|uniref:hypothetical protein n=1 Tax=Streptomyces sp. NPDC051020 TaxID=3155409 RepID=UPI0034167309
MARDDSTVVLCVSDQPPLVVLGGFWTGLVLSAGLPPPDVLSGFLNRLVFSVENVARLLEGSVNLVKSVIIRSGSGWPRECDFRSALCLDTGLRAGSEIAELLLELADLTGSEIRDLLCSVAFFLGSCQLEAKVLSLLLGALEAALGPQLVDGTRAVSGAESIELSCELGYLSLRLAEQREEDCGHLQGLQPGLLADLVCLPHTVELLQCTDRVLLRLDEVVRRIGMSRGG